MKKTLLLLIPSLLSLGGCNNSTPRDPYKVSKEETIKALKFIDSNNFELDTSYFFITDYGTHEEVKGVNIDYYFKDSNNEMHEETQYTHIVTSKEKYQDYCQKKSIEYKEADFNKLIEGFEEDGYSKTVKEGLYTLKKERYEQQYAVRRNSNFVDTIYKIDDRDFEKEFEFNNYESDYTKSHLFDTDYIDPSLFTYDEENKRYNINENSIGGFLTTDLIEELRFDTYKITTSYVSFLNQKLNKLDIFISGTYNSNDWSFSYTAEVKNINQVAYQVPAAEYEKCSHGDYFFTNDNNWHCQVCEDCDNSIEGTEAACTYDENGECTVCGREHTAIESILSYTCFGCPVDTISRDYIIETGETDHLDYATEIGETEQFDGVLLPDGVTYYEKSTIYHGAYLFFKGGTKTFVIPNDRDVYAVFPEEYTFETRTIKDEVKKVMVVTKTFHDAI